ncbi:erythrocyte membrane-associated malaria like protein [Theileria equi strain WA]|uniref:Erythrocyte membrane-associated malaria like protein n=1 Tax=Theileria equi strain WA TaxID=1537102 RepID=L0AUZ3_THEEQ|nr:erythrocyte membrane-associated malaria like protein [Theileria equi strain WA]AFZ79063.1 erythrocyte membrane-associated malaria like protein [Theileria equi strain WA]|eukprot:XP_004828729.1 erythrocyte membrane-associated malaria like protein [Theileria equi strain WA]
MANNFLKVLLVVHFIVVLRSTLCNNIALCTQESASELINKTNSIPLEYISGTGYAISVKVGSQPLLLALNSTVCGIVLFEDTKQICFHDDSKPCYIPSASTTASWCNNNTVCVPGTNKFSCVTVASPDSIKDVTPIYFHSNGFKYELRTLEGFENISLKIDHKEGGYDAEKIPVKLARTINVGDYPRILKNVDGIFGLAGLDICCRGKSLWNNILNDYEGYFVVDINKPDYNNPQSKIYLGLDKLRDSEIAWSEKRQFGGIYNNAYLQFTMYNFTMCGVNLFGKVSSNWEAIIDLSSESLVVPKNFWITIMTYLPVDPSCFTQDNKPKYCTLKKDSSGDFPLLQFKLKEDYHVNFDKVTNPTITIPLENLLIDDGESWKICILPDEISEPSPYTISPTIKIGYKVLESLNIAIDTKGNRIGLINKNQIDGTSSKCTKKISCVGDQVYEPALNVCVDPYCNVWLMKRLNKETG